MSFYRLISDIMFSEVNETNITEGAIEVQDRLIDTNPMACVAIFANYLFLLIFGNGMLSLIIIYERNAMDPGKRFINNTLLSMLCFNSIVQNVIFSNFLTYQLIFGTPGSLSKFSYLSSYKILVGYV